MHGAIAFAAVLGLIALAFGPRAAKIVAQLICFGALGFGAFFAYVVYCALVVL